MMLNTHRIVSMTEANRNFSRVARLVDQSGAAIIMKNNAPRYLVLDFSQFEAEQSADTEDVLAVAKRLLEKNEQAYEDLSKSEG